MYNKAILLLIVVALVSCSDKEKRAQALKDLDNAQAKLIEVKTTIEGLENKLTYNRNNLEVVKDDLNQVKEFQLLRTEAEREEQIRRATENIRIVETNISTLEGDIEYFEDSVLRTEMHIARLQEYLKN